MSSTGEGDDVPIEGGLVAKRYPHSDTWEIHDAEDFFRGRVVKTASGFQALKPFGNEFYSVGTFVSLETAVMDVVGTSGPLRR